MTNSIISILFTLTFIVVVGLWSALSRRERWVAVTVLLAGVMYLVVEIHDITIHAHVTVSTPPGLTNQSGLRMRLCQPVPDTEIRHLFCYIQNIEPVDPDKVEYSNPTNVEFRFRHEPVLAGQQNGEWVVHFKP